MAAAFLVTYSGPRGKQCPDAIVVCPPGIGEDVAPLALSIKETLVSARGGGWESHHVTIHSIKYLGPWFSLTRAREFQTTPG